ncbi:MAG: OmpA family protein, partial [Planctomycetota bacterium]
MNNESGNVREENPVMLPPTRYAWLLAVAGVAIGCGQNFFLAPQQQAARQQEAAQLSKVQELQRRVHELDTSNSELHRRLAQSQQQTKVSMEETDLLQKQLQETAEKLRETQLAKQDAERSVQMLQASAQKQVGAKITANNSIRQSLDVAEIPGAEVSQEKDVIRIRIPADELFQQSTVQLTQDAYGYLDEVANAITRNYAEQRIAIEGYTDSAPAFGRNGTTNHQLATMQALAVFDILTRRNRLPTRQLFVMGLGANHPRASNATEAGRAR